MPSSSGCGRSASSVFQPMCGIFSAGSARRDPVDLAAIQPSPSVTSYSRPRSAMSCMPTQMPRNGRPLRAHAFVQRLDHAGHAHRARAGNRRRRRRPAARRDRRGAPHPGSLVTTIGCVVPALARGALERLGRGMQIARAVIDDRDAHRSRSRLRETGRSPRARQSGCAAATPAMPMVRDGDRHRIDVSRLTQASKNRRSAASRSSRHHDAEIVPAAPRERPAPQRCRLEADQQREHEAAQRSALAGRHAETPTGRSAAPPPPTM